MKYWLVATYKINEIKRVENNLLNQNFDYYLPKIKVVKPNSNHAEEVLFPGYIFINTRLENYSSIKYTIGIKKVIKFGNSIPHLTNNEIKSIQSIEKLSQSNPLSSIIKIGQEAFIADGPFKGNLVKICSLPSKGRVEVLLTFLGYLRRVKILKEDLLI
jgi:transcription antitermination factor NusG